MRAHIGACQGGLDRVRYVDFVSPLRALFRWLLPAAVLLTPSLARASDPHPSAPFVELGGGVAGSVLGYALGLPVLGVCAHGPCRDFIIPTFIALGSFGASAGVIVTGSAYPRYGSAGGAFLGGAAGMAVAVGAMALLTLPEATKEVSPGIKVGVLAVTGLLLPSLGATIGYDAFRDRSKESPSAASPAALGVFFSTGAVAF